MAALATETREELIGKYRGIRDHLNALERDGKTEENCEEARLLEDELDEVLDVLDMERIERILNDPNDRSIPYDEARKELALP